MKKHNAPSITAVILTLNEESNIKNCLGCLDWTDRIIIVDSGSTDKTLEYAADFGCEIYFNPWPGFATQRNWALDKIDAKTEWVIFIDADEEVTPDLQDEIHQTLKFTSCNAFYLCYKVILFGKWVKHSSNFPVWHPRLVRLGKVRFKDAVTGHGETWDVDGKVGYIQEPYNHYSFSKGIKYWFDKHNRHSTMECAAYFAQKSTFFESLRGIFFGDPHHRRQALRLLSYKLPFRAFLRLVHQLIIKGGILDGPAGWTYCFLYFAYEIMISAKIKEQKYFYQVPKL